ncbi:unnamed protein product [Calypogeia fissa]
MAFTSKVIFMLLASSLTWWQASSKGSTPTTTIDDTLTSITTISNNLTTQVVGITDMTFAMVGPKIAPGIEEIANAFTQGDTYLKTVSGQLSDTDGDAVVEKFKMLVVALEKLLEALSAKNTFTGLKVFTEQISAALVCLRSAAIDGDSFDLVSLLPVSVKKAGRNLIKQLSTAIVDALKRYNQECQ